MIKVILRKITLTILTIFLLMVVPFICTNAATANDVANYSYEVMPLVAPFNSFLYLKTDNPDVSSIYLIDKSTKYSDEQAVYELNKNIYADVKYDNQATYRVAGGYLFTSVKGYTDGGKLSIAVSSRKIVDYMWTVVYEDTGVEVDCSALTSSTDYLVDKYTNSSMTFWEKMDAVDSALGNLAVYPFTVFDESKPIEGRYPYYIRSRYNDNTAPIIWQGYSNLYESSYLLLKSSYPFVLDSASYPSLISSVAKTLEPTCTISGNTYDHSLRTIELSGEKHVYGGQGKGGSNPVTIKNILYLFDGTTNDYSINKSLSQIGNKLLEYKSLGDSQVTAYQEQLQTLYDEGGWGKIAGFSYADYVYCGNQPYIGKIENAWVDGRYIDIDGYYSFYGNDESPSFEDHPKANILLHNITYTNVNGETVVGDVLYKYDEIRGAWYSLGAYFGKSSYGYNNSTIWNELPKELMLTESEVATMTLDVNSGKLPESGRIYDGTATPGTAFSNVNVTGINLSSKKVEVEAGNTEGVKLIVDIVPANATIKKVQPLYTDIEGPGINYTEFNAGKSSEIRVCAEKSVVPGEYVIHLATVDGHYVESVTVVVKEAKTVATDEGETSNPTQNDVGTTADTNSSTGSGNIKNGLSQANDGTWYLYNNGKVATDYNDLYCDPNYGWWKVAGGEVDFGYTGLYNSPTYGWWLIGGGAVAFDYTGLWGDPTYGWWLIGGGAVAFDYTGLWGDPNYGWWLVGGGQVAFNYTGLWGDPNYGWWLVGGGTVAFDYNDLWGDPNYGWWKVVNGTIDFDYHGVYESPIYGAWNISGGMVLFE